MATHSQLFVISDLHLGGEPGLEGKPGFQICPPRTQQRLAGFIEGLPLGAIDERTHLVLAGDIVDFLAERDFQAFTGDERLACEKLQKIIDRTQPVWSALASFVSGGGYLTLMLGNHDIELCLPRVRRLLADTLGEGRVEFLYDNEAFTLGPVIVEHGNRYDAWNAVPHDSLRGVRSRLSRGMPVNTFPAMPGSQLVVEVMNEVKERYSWVDLLKPETAGVLPVLAALGAGNLTRVWKGFRKFQQSLRVEYEANQEPEDQEYIAASDDTAIIPSSDQAMYDLAQNIASGGSSEEVSAVGDLLEQAREAVSDKTRALRRSSLQQALRALVNHHRLTFDTKVESETYLTPAQESAERGFEVVIYGHTHLVKKIPLKSTTDNPACYLNTGTWADLMRMPDAIFDSDDSLSEAALDEFLADLDANDVARWRRAAPTFAKVELEDDRVLTADVFFTDESGSEPATTEGLVQRLTSESTS